MMNFGCQARVMVDVLQAAWACFRSESLTRAQLAAAGFERVEIKWGSPRMFPTVRAFKPA